MSYLASENINWNGVAILRAPVVRMLMAGLVFALFELIAKVQGAGMAVMVLTLGAYCVGLTRTELAAVVRALPVLAYGFLALFSAVWSDFASVTLRLALQLLITGFAGLLVYRTLSFRDLRQAIFWSGLAVTVFGVLSGWRSIIYGLPFAGVAESKNMMAFIASVPTLAGASIVMDSRGRGLVRMLVLGGTLFAAMAVVFAQSAGATVGTAVGVLAIIGGQFFISAPQTVRLTVVVAVLLMVPVGVIAQSLVVSQANEFTTDVLGKDATISGRTELWKQAADFFSERPVGGRGYGAFWVQGSTDAEGLWARFGVTGRSGFNFHNQFVDAAVDLGVLGVVTLVFSLLIALGSLAVRLLTGRSAELPYFAGLFIALVVRLPVESVMLAQFNIITVMFFMTLTATVYGQDAAPVRLAGGVRRGLRRQKLDRGLVQQREVRRSRKPKMLRHTKVVKPAVHGPRRRRGKRVLRQTRRPLDAGSKPSDDGAST